MIKHGSMFLCVVFVLLFSCQRPEPAEVTLKRELSILKSVDSQDEVTAGVQRKARIKAIEEELKVVKNDPQND